MGNKTDRRRERRKKRRRAAYINASRKMAHRPTLRSKERLSFHTSGMGIRMMTKSTPMLGTLKPISQLRRLMHLALTMVLSHSACTGRHWKMVDRTTAVPHTTTKAKEP